MSLGAAPEGPFPNTLLGLETFIACQHAILSYEELIYALLKASLLYNLESEAGRIYRVFV